MPKVTLTSLDAKLDYLTKTVEEIDHTVNGNGKEGLKTLVDRLVQIEVGRKWIIRLLVTAVTSGAVMFGFSSLGG